mgnify:FL=1
MDFANMLLKVLRAAAEGTILVKKIGSLIGSMEDSSGTTIAHMSDEQLVSLLRSRPTKTPEELLEIGRKQIDSTSTPSSLNKLVSKIEGTDS